MTLERNIKARGNSFYDSYLDLQEHFVSVEECLKAEERALEARLFGMYFKMHYDPDVITVREYSKLQKQFREDPAFRWQVLKEISRTERKV